MPKVKCLLLCKTSKQGVPHTHAKSVPAFESNTAWWGSRSRHSGWSHYCASAFSLLFRRSSAARPHTVAIVLTLRLHNKENLQTFAEPTNPLAVSTQILWRGPQSTIVTNHERADKRVWVRPTYGYPKPLPCSKIAAHHVVCIPWSALYPNKKTATSLQTQSSPPFMKFPPSMDRIASV